MIPEYYATQMGRAVAKDILGTENLETLDKELEKINKDVREGKTELLRNPENYPSLMKVLRVVARSQDARNLGGLGSHTYIPAELKKNIDTPSETLKSCLTYFHQRGDFNDFSKLIFWALFSPSKEIKKIKCTSCGQLAPIQTSPFSLRLFNKSDYWEDAQFDSVCAKCRFYHYVANTYPSPVARSSRPLGAFYFKILSDSSEVLDYAVFFSDSFARFIRKWYIDSKLSSDIKAPYIVFYKAAKKSENVVWLAHGRFNIVDELFKMMENDKDKVKVVNHFLWTFVNGEIPKEIGEKLLPFFIELIQNSTVNDELIHLFLEGFRRSDYTNKKVKDNLLNFDEFLKAFYEVKKMDKEKDAISLGYRIGNELVKVAKDEYEIDQIRKHLTALSGTMELSEKTFLDGILHMQRTYRLSIYTKELDSIAKIPKQRVSFLVGLLSGVFYSNYTRGGV